MGTVAADRLAGSATGILVACGVPAGHARMVVDSLVRADLWGHQSHGVPRLPWYVARLRSGAMAARHGLGAVAVRNSNHFGTAAYFTRMAPPKGCIGFLATNSSPAMAPWGGRERAVGSNPWSLAAPIGDGRQMVMDIANTAVARGKIYLARNRGVDIPPDWATTSDGRPTTDPAEAIAGMILPMAGHKGYAISLMMDVLAGVLTGSGFGAAVHGPYQPTERSGCGHLYLALDITAFLPMPEFLARMTTLVDQLKSNPPADGATEVHYPGEIEDRTEERTRAEGIRLPDRTVDELERLAAELGVGVELSGA